MTTTLRLGSEVLAAVRTHVNAHVDLEVGGVLLGTLDDGTAHVEAALPALQAVGHRANVTFTHEVWEEILPVVDREFPGLRIVGWYHSHPGFGIFLSDYDTFIHRNFFSNPGMLALVVDPHTGRHGVFGWDGDEVALLEEGGSSDHAAAAARPAPGRTASRRGNIRRRPTAVLVAATAVVLAFAAGWTVASTDRSVGEAASAEDAALTAAQAEIAELRARLAPADHGDDAGHGAPDDAGPPAAEPDGPAGPPESAQPEGPDIPGTVAVAYRVRRGDTLWALAESFYGSGGAYRVLLDANPEVDPRALAVGHVLEVHVDAAGLR